MKNFMSEVHSPLFHGIKPDEVDAMLSCILFERQPMIER